jgi:hypothetical protein
VSNLKVVKSDDYSLAEIKGLIKDNINKTAQAFIAIGYYLKCARDSQLYLEDGYKNIWEFAQDEFNFSQSWASRCIAVNNKFSVNGNSPIIQEKYKDFSKCLLSEMLNIDDELMEKVKPTTTRDEIRDLKINHVDYTKADIDRELERREAKLEALQDDGFIEDLRKRAQIKLDAVALLKDSVSTERQPHYCPHCHMLIEEGD